MAQKFGSNLRVDIAFITACWTYKSYHWLQGMFKTLLMAGSPW